MITVDFILGVILGLMWFVLMIGSLVFSVYAFAQFVITFLPDKTAEETETENEAFARRSRQATLNVFGRMSGTEQQAFRQRGGVLPGESGWADPWSLEQHASFVPGGLAGRVVNRSDKLISKDL